MGMIQPAGMIWRRFKVLLAGNPEHLAQWTGEPGARPALVCAAVFAASCAIYGATFGLWRSELQALFTAIKFPLVVFLTCGGNALLNGCLAQVLGTGLSFRQSSLAILMSFTITGIVLAAFAPLMVFVFWNVPSIHSADAGTGGAITLLSHVALIAFAGIVGNHHLWRLLRHLTGSRGKADAVLFAWLAGNLLLGSQISWILRPWIGQPGVPIGFFSDHPLRGNFFEAVWHAAASLFL